MDMIPLFLPAGKGFYVNFFIFGNYVNDVMSTPETGGEPKKRDAREGRLDGQQDVVAGWAEAARYGERAHFK